MDLTALVLVILSYAIMTGVNSYMAGPISVKICDSDSGMTSLRCTLRRLADFDPVKFT